MQKEKSRREGGEWGGGEKNRYYFNSWWSWNQLYENKFSSFSSWFQSFIM